MKGINSDAMDSLINYNVVKLDSIRENINSIRRSYLEIKRCLRSQDLMFLVSKVENELNQLVNSYRKLESYESLLKSLLVSYKNESIKVTNNINRIKP